MKFLKTLLCLLFVILLLAGCSKNKPLPSVQDVAGNLKSLSSDAVVWAELDITKISSYFGITDHNISEFAGFVNNSEEFFDIIAVFKLKTEDAKEDVINGISFIAKNADNTFKIANKSVSDKISNKIVAEKDDLIILCIMDNYSQVSKYLTDELGAKIIS